MRPISWVAACEELLRGWRLCWMVFVKMASVRLESATEDGGGEIGAVGTSIF
jgi:hypothetical protein